MAQLRQGYEELRKLDAEVVVIGPEKEGAFRRYFRTHKLPFVGLPDPKHEVLDLFGQETSVVKLGRMPAQVIIDREGTVRSAHYGHSMSDIPSNEELLDLLASLEPAPAEA